MAKITIKDLLDAGVHFGHPTRRWNPKMKPYIFGARNGIYIFDLMITMEKLQEACQFLFEVVSDGGEILFGAIWVVHHRPCRPYVGALHLYDGVPPPAPMGYRQAYQERGKYGRSGK